MHHNHYQLPLQGPTDNTPAAEATPSSADVGMRPRVLGWGGVHLVPVNPRGWLGCAL